MLDEKNHFGSSPKEQAHNINIYKKKEMIKKSIDDLCYECVFFKGINPVSNNRLCNREGLFYVKREDAGVRKVKDCGCFVRSRKNKRDRVKK